jgi:hypothetical protein
MGKLGSLKREPTGRDFFSIGVDGVLRVYHSDSFEVIDAIRMSPSDIKTFLDRLPFDQAKEDKYRGVDGSGVSDEDMFNPSEEIRPQRPSKEALENHQKVVEERERNGVKKNPDAVCWLPRSNYNLDPI